jgi:hypothetical protein
MSDLVDSTLDNCGCCEPDPAPAPLYNRPGLPALAYRAGTYGTIYRRMLERLGRLTLQDGDFAGTRPLAALTTREPDDPSIALLDASAVVADVLTFYQERVANEGFLRTATERRSILELAREIGYELSPGVAASVYLSFTVDEAQGAPGVSTIPAGTKVQSLPPQGKLPQPFETSQLLVAHKEWNTLRPRLSTAQNLVTGISEIYLKGTGSNLKTGDVVLVSSGVYTAAVHVDQVEIDAEQQLTHVTLQQTVPALGGVPGVLTATVWGGEKIPFNAGTIAQNILQKTWEDADLNAFFQANAWDAQALVNYLAAYHARQPEVVGYADVMRARLGIFGNNAPKYETLPDTQRGAGKAYPASWENRDLTTDSQGTALTAASFFLERSMPSVLPGGYVALENGSLFSVYPITGVVETTLADYGQSTKVTGLTVTTPFASAALNSFKVRGTTAYVQSEPLTLAEKPLTTDLAAGATQLELDSFVLGLKIGQPVSLSGERADAKGLTQSEILILKAITHPAGRTKLTFETGLTSPYLRSTVRLNANTVAATHGETVNEVLGSGDGAQIHQKFTLKKPPLTYVPAPTPGGSASTLQLRVNNLLWEAAASLYNLDAGDQAYILRLAEPPTGSGPAPATVLFGDGEKGARLPTGQNNVTVTYRSGIGLAGEVDAGSLTLLPSKPFGVRSVVNPLPASGAGDPEKMENARRNAPLTVRTLDRIVSREDYEDFSAAFAGIGKAQAIDLWSGESHLVHVTIAGADGEPVGAGLFRDNFLLALNAARDPSQAVKVSTFTPLFFNLSANLALDRRYQAADVFAAVKAALETAFSFAQRAFGQPVTAAEIITVIQNVAGVTYVDLDALFFSSDSPTLNQILPASLAHVKNGALQNAELLLINFLGIQLQEVSA